MSPFFTSFSLDSPEKSRVVGDHIVVAVGVHTTGSTVVGVFVVDVCDVLMSLLLPARLFYFFAQLMNKNVYSVFLGWPLLWLQAATSIKVLGFEIQPTFTASVRSTLQRHNAENWKRNIPRKGTAWLQSQSQHSCFCE